jgi:hypothetical protein
MLLSRTGQPYVVSGWYQQAAGPSTFQLRASLTMDHAIGGPVSPSWMRVYLPFTGDGSTGNIFPADARNVMSGGGIASGARDDNIDLFQIEAGAFGTEAIPSSGGPATRAGEHLYAMHAAALVDSGRISFEAVVQPKGARSAYSAPFRIWSVDASNFAEVDPTSGDVRVEIGGVVDTASGLAFNANDTVDLFVAAGGGMATIARVRVNSGSAADLPVTGAPLPALAASTTIDVLCNGTSNQWSGWVQSLRAYRSGVVPF